MKKYALYILILIALVGVFVPIFAVHASPGNPSEPCTYNNGTLNPDNPPCGTGGGPAAAVDRCASVVGIGKIICKINQILQSIVPLLIALGLVYFLWGVVQYVIGDEGEAKKKGKDKIIYGIIGLAVVVSVWGLVYTVVRTFSIEGGITDPAGSVVSSLNSNSSPCPSPSSVNNPNLQYLLVYISCIISTSVVPLIFALAVVMFLWGVVQFVINSDEEVKKAKGKQFMLWGIIALTVMVSVWGLVEVLGSTFGIDTEFFPKVKP